MKVDVFVIDPPWPKKKGGKRKARPNQGKELDYLTLSVEDIFKILDNDVLIQASLVHTVFLWSIDQFLVAGEQEMTRRGYRLHARMIWDKGNGVAPAFSVRYCHEYVGWFYKPRFSPVSKESRGKTGTVLKEAAREHSRKPNALYEAINSWYPGALKMDVFSREYREGWLQYGDEVNHFELRRV